jgi:ubiquinone/menaquinone biosynthesis C-methylase UbiE
MIEHARSSPGDLPEAPPDEFYETRYAPDRQRLQDMICREVYDDYFGQNSWITTANYGRFYGWLEVTSESRVLDVACGNGAPALRLARMFGCMVWGIDSNAHAIARASAVTRERELSERVRFEIHDAGQRLPFPDRVFDAVTCLDALGHLPDRPSVFAEWARVLKPGGRLLFTDQVITGPVSKEEIARRAPWVYVEWFQSGYGEQLLKQSGFEVLRREDLTADLADLARRHCAVRAAHADALRASEGDAVFEEQNRYRAVAEQLARERRLSHCAFLARKGT